MARGTDYGVPTLRERILRAVVGDCEIAELAQRLSCSRAALDQQLHRLVEHGVLARERIGVYRLTELGLRERAG